MRRAAQGCEPAEDGWAASFPDYHCGCPAVFVRPVVLQTVERFVSLCSGGGSVQHELRRGTAAAVRREGGAAAGRPDPISATARLRHLHAAPVPLPRTRARGTWASSRQLLAVPASSIINSAPPCIWAPPARLLSYAQQAHIQT
ncbi:hypothetical protein SKAU_G00133250 [Synaphobranchus kaupii]|uniref:Uncharacterized protein n=1 Tax=Synaphobranchus kaupii TaxID=118154 RepID=A0A9Q1FR22_SYNKA|nr:hypothetical protein SKAU_G00133250 [Synaphobranchus kaupii]